MCKLIVRVLGGSFTVIAWIISTKLLPLSLAILLLSLNPLWTSFLAGLFLEEKFTKKNLLVFITGFFGIILVVKPSFLFN